MHKRPRRELSGGGDKKPRTSDKNSTTSSTKTKGAEEEKRRSKRKAKPEVSEGGHITSDKKRRKRKRSGQGDHDQRVAEQPSWLNKNEGGVSETTNKKKRKKTTSKKVGQPKRKKKANDSGSILSKPKQQENGDGGHRRQGRNIEDGVLVALPFSKAVKQEPTEEGDSGPVWGYGHNLSVLRKENGVDQREPKEEKKGHDDADVDRDEGGKAATQDAEAHGSVSMPGKVSTSAANSSSASLPSSSTLLPDPAQLVEALLFPSSQPMPSGAEELTIKRGSDVPSFLLSPAFGCWMPVQYYHSLLGYLRGMATCIDALE